METTKFETNANGKSLAVECIDRRAIDREQFMELVCSGWLNIMADDLEDCEDDTTLLVAKMLNSKNFLYKFNWL